MAPLLSLLGKTWEISKFPEAEVDFDGEDLTDVFLKILSLRNIRSSDDLKTFMYPSLKLLNDPALLHDSDKAADRILKAVKNRERVLIYGDYDADGVTASAVLVRFLREMFDLEPEIYLPCRFEDGYGLSKPVIEKIIAEKKPDLIVTVDNGTTAFEEAELLAKKGIDLVITDHHIPADELPVAAAVVNPKIGESYPFREISGAAVAFKVAWETARKYEGARVLSEKFKNFLLDVMGLVAIGTVSDVMPLIDENRVIVHYGLKALSETSHPGLKALREIAIPRGNQVKCRDIYFGFGPRLNASGRISHSRESLNLLISNDPEEAPRLAEELNRINNERRRIGLKLTENACAYFENMPSLDEKRILVYASEDMHQGISGLVAARVAERFGRPTMVFAITGEESVGSGRSYGNFNLFEAIKSCADLCTRYGGHAYAGGLTLPTENLKEFEERIEKFAFEKMNAEDLVPRLDVDLKVRLNQLSVELARELRRLAPVGKGNPAPLFMVENVRVQKPSVETRGEGKHLSFYVTDENFVARCFGLGMGELAPKIKRHPGTIDLAFTTEEDTYMGNGSFMLLLKDIRLKD